MLIDKIKWKITYLLTGETWTNENAKFDPCISFDNVIYQLALHRYEHGAHIMYMDMENIAFNNSRLDGRITAYLIDECENWDELPIEYLVELYCPISG